MYTTEYLDHKPQTKLMHSENPPNGKDYHCQTTMRVVPVTLALIRQGFFMASRCKYTKGCERMITSEEAVQVLMSVNKGCYAPTLRATIVREFTESYPSIEKRFIRDPVLEMGPVQSKKLPRKKL